MTNTVKKIWNVFTGVIVALVVLIAVFLIGVRAVGLRPFAVLTGSMVPDLPVGSLVYVKECSPEEVKPGDTITFVFNENLDVVTHKVHSVDTEKQLFYTYGIANKDSHGNYVMDGGTKFQNLIGKPLFAIPYLGYLSNAIMSPPGSYIAIIVIVAMVILAFLPDIVNRGSRRKEAHEHPDSEIKS